MEPIIATTASTMREYVSYHLDVGASSRRSYTCQKIKHKTNTYNYVYRILFNCQIIHDQ
jgi:hypothetical protein